MPQAYTQGESREFIEWHFIGGTCKQNVKCEFYDYTICNTNKQNVQVTKKQDGIEVWVIYVSKGYTDHIHLPPIF